MKDFFISYNKADRVWAEWIAWQLDEAGFTTVIQAWDYAPGSNFVLNMQRDAAQAAHTIAVLSPDYLAANFTQPEWAAAFARDPKGEKGILLPVRVRECDLEGLLGQIVYIDLVGKTKQEAKEELLKWLRNKNRSAAGVNIVRVKPKTEPVFPGNKPSLEHSQKSGDVDVLETNLPLELDSFVGREQELKNIGNLLFNSHIVTLTGVGGVGKSRLAREFAARTQKQYEGRIWLVRLASLSEPTQITQKIMDAIGISEEVGHPFTSTIAHFIKSQAGEVLLLMDNCEHLWQGCAQIVKELLQACPNLRFLATSQRPLGVPGEKPLLIHPFKVPDADHPPRIDELINNSAIDLFLKRASSPIEITEQNAKAFAQVCRQLDGIPLAIELVAARMEDFRDIEEVAEKLSNKLVSWFKFLELDAVKESEHHQRMWATIDWSYQLLTEPEQKMLNRISVFAGGWEQEAAEKVCAGKTIPVDDVFHLLSWLKRKSLVFSETQDGALRYRLLQTIRRFGLAHLETSGEASVIKHRHAEYYVELAEKAEPGLKQAEQREWLLRLEREHDNFRAALGYCQQEAEECNTGLRLAGALWLFWQVRGYRSEGRALLEAMIASADGCPDATRVKAIYAAGRLAWAQGDYEGAQRLLEDSRAIYAKNGDKAGLAWSLHDLGNVERERYQYGKALEFYEQGLALFNEIGEKWGIAWTHHDIGRVERDKNNLEYAKELFEQSQKMFEDLGDIRGVACSYSNFGQLERRQENFRQAKTSFQQGLTLFEELGDSNGIAWALHHLGSVERFMGNLKDAATLYDRSINTFQGIGDRRGVAWSKRNLGKVSLAMGDIERAVVLCREILTTFQEVEDMRGVAAAYSDLGDIASARHELPEAEKFYKQSFELFERFEDKHSMSNLRKKLDALGKG